MKRQTRKVLSMAAIAALSLQLLVLLGTAPVTFAVTSCSATNNNGGYAYTLTVNGAPCSPATTPNNTPITATGTSNNTAVTSVTIDFYNSSNLLVATFSGSLGTPTPSVTLTGPGTWSIVSTFYAGAAVAANARADISVQILVLNELPLGTIAAVGIALVGLFTVRRLSKTFSVATPATH